MKRKNTVALVVLLGATLLLPAACTDGEAMNLADIPIAVVQLSETNVVLRTGETRRLNVSLFDANRRLVKNRSVTWASSDPATVEVSSAGLLTAVSPGTASVSANASSVIGTAQVTVVASPPASLVIQPATATLTVGQTLLLQPTLRDSAGAVLTGVALSWTSSNPAAVTVEASGTVRAVGAGVATVSAGVAGVSAATVITVPVPTAASVTLEPAAVQLAAGATTRLQAVARAGDGSVLTGRTVSWRSTAATVASVATDGTVTGQSAGMAGIIATVDAVSDTTVVTVTADNPQPAITGLSPAEAAVGASAVDLVVSGTGFVPGSVVQWNGASRTTSFVSSTQVRIQLTASDLAAEGTFGVRVANPAPGGGTSNALNFTVRPPAPNPGGSFNLVAERDWSTLIEAGWSYARVENSTVMTDAGAPRSAPGFVRQNYLLGMSGGGEPSVYEKAFAGGDSVYLEYWVRYSANWHGHESGVNKMIYLAVGTGDHVFRLYTSATGINDGPLRLQIRTQETVEGARNLDPNLGSAEIVRGQWHRIEVLAVTNTPGQFNGQVHWWLDGRKVGEVFNIGWVRVGENVNWNRFHWAPVWGGRGDVLPVTQHMDMDHVRIGVR